MGDVGTLRGEDLRSPAGDGAPETSDRQRHLGSGEVAADLGDSLDGELLVGMVLDITKALSFPANHTSRFRSPARRKPISWSC